MRLLGLLLSVCYVPGIVGAFIPTQWALFSAILPLGLWHPRGVFIPATWAGLALLAWSAFTLLWAPNTYDAAYGLWLACLIAIAFHWGTTIDDFRPLWQGLALGVWANSAVALAQYLDYTPVVTSSPGMTAGLFFNSTLLGCVATLVIIALVTQRQWLYIPGCLPALALAGSRGAFLVLTLTLATRFLRLRYVLLLGLALCVALIVLAARGGSDSDIQRLTIWGMALRNLTPWGNGIGSFSTFLIYNGQMLYPERAHNDYLQLWFELGVGAIPIYAGYVLALRQRTSDHWPIFFAFATFGLFYFPLWAPIPAFIGAVAAGAMLRNWHLDRVASTLGRYVSLPRPALGGPSLPHSGPSPIPVPAPNP